MYFLNNHKKFRSFKSKENIHKKEINPKFQVSSMAVKPGFFFLDLVGKSVVGVCRYAAHL